MKGNKTLAIVAVPFVIVALFAGGCGGGGSNKKKEPTAAPELDTSGRVRLAQAYVKAGRVPEALSTLEEATQKDPQNASLFNYYGQVCFISARYPQAEQALKRALELDEYLTDAHNNLGAVYDKLGRKDEAEKEYLLALEDPAYPTPEKVHLNLGLLYSSQGRTDQAIDHLRRAVEANPRYYQAHFELASILDREGQLEEAAREYEVAAPAYRNSGDFHYRIGFVYMRLDETHKAREHLTKVLEISPGSHRAVQADKLLAMFD